MAATIISTLLIALVMVGVAGFNSLKGDIRASETRSREDMKEFRAEVKADNRVLNDKLDRLLEIVLTSKS